MIKAKVILELDESGGVNVLASIPDAAVIVLILEKAKLKILDGLTVVEKPLVMPMNGNAL